MPLIQHSQYAERASQWRKVRDVIAGEDQIKAAGTLYLPRLTSHEDLGNDQYEAYKRRAQFWGAAKRTQQGLVGAILRKPLAIEGADEAVVADVQLRAGRRAQPLATIVQQVLNDLVSVGRGAMLVDRDPAGEHAPYITWFDAESICFWSEAEIAGRVMPNCIAIEQTYDEPADNDPIGYRTTKKPQLLLLRLGTPPADVLEMAAGGFNGAPADEPVYWQEIRRPDVAGKDGLVLHEVRVPTKAGGQFWSEIPCDVVNAVSGIALDCEEPQMLDLANLLIGHYLNSADLEWGRHMCAIPQPWVSGFQVGEGDRLVVGCGFAWVTEQTGAQVQYLEFSGAGLGHIADGMRAKEQQAAVLGARMLETQQTQAEAVGTVKLRQAGDRSVLATIAGNAAHAITNALRRLAEWSRPGSGADIVASLSTDFDSGQLDPGELQALTAALQGGTMSWETYAWNLRRGEMLPPGVSDDDERRRIQMGAPGRSRRDEIAILQADVTAGRITHATYLRQVQALGLHAGIDVDAEVEQVEQEKIRSVERQMEAMAARAIGAGVDEPAPAEEPAAP